MLSIKNLHDSSDWGGFLCGAKSSDQSKLCGAKSSDQRKTQITLWTKSSDKIDTIEKNENSQDNTGTAKLELKSPKSSPQNRIKRGLFRIP